MSNLPPKYLIKSFPDYKNFFLKKSSSPKYEIFKKNQNKIFFIDKKTKENIIINTENIRKIWRNAYIWKKTSNINEEQLNIIYQLQMALYEILNKEQDTEDKIELELEKEKKLIVLHFLKNNFEIITENYKNIKKLIEIIYCEFWIIYQKHEKENEKQYKKIFYEEMDILLENFIVDDEDNAIEYVSIKEKNKTDINKNNIIQGKRMIIKRDRYGYFKSEIETKRIIRQEELIQIIEDLEEEKKNNYSLTKKEKLLLLKNIEKKKKN